MYYFKPRPCAAYANAHGRNFGEIPMKRLHSIILLFLVMISANIYAEQTPIKTLHHYTLKNGLELFVAENHIVPLATIEIVVRGGAIAHTRENAGLFHLYEHMMFKGNSKYKTSEAMQQAINRLGVSSYNGMTGAEHINYFFTVPSDRVEEGLEFWSYAIRTPLLNKREFEAEKKVVLSEINGDFADPSYIMGYAIAAATYPDAPWIMQAAGAPDVVENATIAQLKQIKDTYYIPNNSALFVSGDVDPEKVYKMVNKIYGTWKRGKDPWAQKTARFSRKPFEKPRLMVMPHPQISEAFAGVNVLFRGIDTDFDTDSVYGAALLHSITSQPHSVFSRAMVHGGFNIPEENYTGIDYAMRRRTGSWTTYATMLSPDGTLPQRAIDFAAKSVEALYASIPPETPEGDEIIERILRRTRLEELYDHETAASVIDLPHGWWIECQTDICYGFNERFAATTRADMKSFLDEYIKDQPPLIVVIINPEIYKQNKAAFDKAGFEEITAENAYYFNKVKAKAE